MEIKQIILGLVVAISAIYLGVLYIHLMEMAFLYQIPFSPYDWIYVVLLSLITILWGLLFNKSYPEVNIAFTLQASKEALKQLKALLESEAGKEEEQ